MLRINVGHGGGRVRGLDWRTTASTPCEASCPERGTFRQPVKAISRVVCNTRQQKGLRSFANEWKRRDRNTSSSAPTPYHTLPQWISSGGAATAFSANRMALFAGRLSLKLVDCRATNLLPFRSDGHVFEFQASAGSLQAGGKMLGLVGWCFILYLSGVVMN